jgi:hypothetical protein
MRIDRAELELASNQEDRSLDRLKSRESASAALGSLKQSIQRLKKPIGLSWLCPRNNVTISWKAIPLLEHGVENACHLVRCRHSGLTHANARSHSGATSWENVVACCHRCNAHKRDRAPAEARMQLKRKPFAPRFTFSTAYGVIPTIDPIWEKYLPRG